MASYAIPGTTIYASGISDWRFLYPGEEWTSFGPIRDGKIEIKTVETKDSKLRERPHSILLEASCKVLSTGKTTTLAMLDSLAGVQGHDLALVNGQFVFPGSSSVHTKWKLVIDGNPENDRYIEVMIRRVYPFTSLDGLFASAAQSATTDPVVLFSAWATGSTYIHGAGFTNAYVRNAGETSWETLGALRNSKVEIELQTQPDQIGTYRHTNTVKVDVSADVMFTDRTAPLLKLDDFGRSTSNDFRFDGYDGTQFTFADNLGVRFNYQNTEDADGVQVVTIGGSGAVALTGLDAMFAS